MTSDGPQLGLWIRQTSLLNKFQRGLHSPLNRGPAPTSWTPPSSQFSTVHSPERKGRRGVGHERRQGCRSPLAIRDGREGAGERPGSEGVAAVPQREGCHGGREVTVPRREGWHGGGGAAPVEPAGSVDQVHLCKNILLPSQVQFSAVQSYSSQSRMISLALSSTWEELGAKNLVFFQKRCLIHAILVLCTTCGFQKFCTLEVLERSQVETLCAIREIRAMQWTRWENEIQVTMNYWRGGTLIGKKMKNQTCDKPRTFAKFPHFYGLQFHP